jgi:hypothetical protein
MRGMYLHAERHLAKAGRQGAREGFLPPKGRARRVIFTQENYGDTLAPRQGSALSKAWLPHSRSLERTNCRVCVADSNRPAEVGGGRRVCGWRQGGIVLLVKVYSYQSRVKEFTILI